jgi:glyoxylase-like metal-dependent hydrolase (beta-lactamase superfamily II)
MSQPIPSLPFERDFAPPYGIAEELSPLIARVLCRNPGPFTFRGTASYVIGRKTLAVIDPGPDDPQHLDALAAAIAGRPVTHIFITHTHLDHSPLAARLKALTGAKTAGFGPHGASLAAGDRDARLDLGSDLNFAPDIVLSDGEMIEAGEWAVGAVFTPGHTSNHMSYALAKEGALFPGDHVMAWSTSVVAPPDGNMGDYLRSLEKLIAREDEIYWPTHGPPRREPQRLVHALLAHRHIREAQILNELKKGPSTIPQLVAMIYADVDRHLYAAAAQTLAAHLGLLIEQGKAVREPGSTTDIYRLS